jgi:hypothetical protein
VANHSYQHSVSFANLKTIHEEISTSYTTYQLLSTLDYFIESAIDPIATAWPDWLDNYYAKVVAWQFVRPSVKFSRSHRFGMPHLLFNALTSDDPQEKRTWQKEMFLNRGILFGLVSLFLKASKGFMLLHDPTVRISNRKRALLIAKAEEKCSPYLHASILQAQYWGDKSRWFKDLVMQKYVRLALMNAKRSYTEIEYAKELDDIVQTFLLYMSKAIDRCDARQGVLTTFIQTWFYSARADVRRQVTEGMHTSYEELLESGALIDFTDPDTSMEEIQHLASLSKSLDPDGAIRHALGIPEFLRQEQLKILERFAKR